MGIIVIKRHLALGVSLLLVACGGGGGSNGVAPPPTPSPPPQPPPPTGGGPVLRYSVGGNVVGLRGSGLVLQIGQGETLAIQADGTFVFPTTLADGSPYQVSVAVQPTNLAQNCEISNGGGILSGAAVTGVGIVCRMSEFRVRGTLSGLRGTDLQVVLRSSDPRTPNNALGISPTADGIFEFPLGIEDGSSYQVSIGRQPGSPRQVCVVANDAGTVNGSHISSPSVTCTTPTFMIGGSVSGLRGQGLVLTNNGADHLPISANGPFTFATPLFDLTSFNVQVSTAPSNLKQHCTVINAINQTSGADVTYVRVECVATQQLGSSGDDEAHAAGTDPSRNLYVAGRTTGSLDGAANAGGWDGFLFKFDPTGEILWRRQLRTAGDDSVEAIAVMGTGEVYVTGYTSGGLEGSSAGGNDIFVAKYDRDGNLSWTRQFGTSESDVAHGLDFLSDGSVYVAGETRGALGGTSAGDSDLFVAKLDASGTLLWLRQFGTPAADAAFGVSVDAFGKAHVGGGTAGNLDGITNTIGAEVGFIVRYDSMGNRQTTHLMCQSRCMRGLSDPLRVMSRVRSIAVGLSGESYVAGWRSDDVSGTFGPRYEWTARIEANGFQPWVQTRTVTVPSIDVEMSSIVLGKGDGGLYMVGNDGSAATGLASAHILRVDPTTLQTIFVDTIADFGYARAEARAITSDLVSNAYVVGRTFASLDGNQHLGGSDIFIVRYNEAGQQL